MDQELNEQLEKAYQSSTRIKKIDEALEKLKEERRNLEDTAYTMKENLAKEGYDVWKEENDKGISSLFHSITGTREELEEKEQKELLSARLKANQAEKNLDTVDELISRLEQERELNEEYAGEYVAFYERKKQELMSESGEKAQKLLDLTEKLNDEKAKIKEITDVRLSGMTLSGSLEGVLTSLRGAEHWGLWDMSGGNVISGAIKYKDMDEAHMQAEMTQRYVYDFKTELTGIDFDAELNVEIGGFTKFADFFFDGIIADWFAQERIYETESNVQRTKDQVTRILGRLDQILIESNEKADGLQKELDEAVVEG